MASFRLLRAEGAPRQPHSSRVVRWDLLSGTWICLCAWLLWGVPNSVGAFGADRCFVCGQYINGTVYLLKDGITLEKVEVCSQCEARFPDCYWCGIPANTNAPGFVQVADGRAICARDARTVVLTEPEVTGTARQVRDRLDRLLSRFLSLPETNVVLSMVDRVHLEDLFKFAGRDYHCPNVWGFTETVTNQTRVEHRICLLSGLPLSWLQATCAHEFTHAWVAEHLSAARRANLTRDAEEGFCELVAYTYMDSLHDEDQKSMILRNGYTRGQIDLFVDAANRYGFNDVVDWVRYGSDNSLSREDAFRLHNLADLPRPPRNSTNTLPIAVPATAAAPSSLILKAVFWDEKRPLAMINDHTFGLHERAKLRVGATNVMVECTSIHASSVIVQVNGSSEQELLLKPK